MTKIYMDNGNVYEINIKAEDINSLLYTYKNTFGGIEVQVLKNEFVYLPCEEDIMINPSHISSIEFNII